MSGLVNSRLFSNTITVVAILVLMTIISFSHDYLSQTNRHESSAGPLLIPPAQLEYFTFGHSEVVADLLWLRSIQSFDFCGGVFNNGPEVSYDQGKTKIKTCEKGWVFQMLDAATRISPRYRVIYRRGAANLSVAINDLQGAHIIYERGLAQFPNDWNIHYQAGYHEAVEMNNPELGAKLFDKAWRLGAPQWVPLLAAQLYKKSGRAELGLRALADFYRDKEFKNWPPRVRERWQSLETDLGRKVNPTEFAPADSE